MDTIISFTHTLDCESSPSSILSCNGSLCVYISDWESFSILGRDFRPSFKVVEMFKSGIMLNRVLDLLHQREIQTPSIIPPIIWSNMVGSRSESFSFSSLFCVVSSDVLRCGRWREQDDWYGVSCDTAILICSMYWGDNDGERLVIRLCDGEFLCPLHSFYFPRPFPTVAIQIWLPNIFCRYFLSGISHFCGLKFLGWLLHRLTKVVGVPVPKIWPSHSDDLSLLWHLDRQWPNLSQWPQFGIFILFVTFMRTSSLPPLVLVWINGG